MIKAIIFDCFGVLTGDLWKEFVASLPDEQKPSARKLNHALDDGSLSHEEFYQQIHELTGRQPAEVEGIITSNMQKNESVLALIRELKSQYKIGLLSNISSDWITDDFLSNDEIALFDGMVFSYQVGVTKPDRRTYEAIAQKLGVEPEHCIMIDDSELNCSGARQVGMQAIIFQDTSILRKALKSMLM